MEKPRLKAHFHVDVVEGERVFLYAEGQDYLVPGKAAAAVVPYLDGRRTVMEIVQELAGTLPIPAVFQALTRFKAAGHLAEGRPDLPENTLAYWDALGIDPAATLGTAPVTVSAAPGTDPGPVLDALRALGLTARTGPFDEVPAEGVAVVLVDDYLDPALERRNERQLAAERPWLLARTGGVAPWIGPFLDPDHTGCWACLAQRLSGNRQLERYLAGKRGESVPRHPARAGIAAGPMAAAGLIAAEAARIAATGEPGALCGQMVTLDLATLSTETHRLIRQPQCPSCGNPALVTERSPKIVLHAEEARHTSDGGYRVTSPEATLARLERHISPHLGAITKLVSHTPENNTLTYSFAAGHNFAMVNDSMDLLRRNLRGQSGGKGRSEVQAKVSAVCEAIERYVGVWRGDEPVLRSAYRDLDPRTAVHPRSLLHFSETQLAGREAWNRDPANRLHKVPDPFPEDASVDWTRGWSLTHDEERLIPAAYAWYGHPDLKDHFFCIADSNGSAAGNTLEEAILQGLCELTERDAVALWWYNRLRRPAFDMDSLDDPYVDRLRAFYDAQDRDLWMLDISCDLGMPVYVAASRRRHSVEDVMVGFGAHPDPRVAAFRALTELNQFLPMIENRDADGNTAYLVDDLETLTWLKEATVEKEPWLLPDPELPATRVGPQAGFDLAARIREQVARIQEAGSEVIVIDQTRPDLELNVVKVIAPGLRHFWRRLGPGRLYDAPVRLGLLAEPTAEADLNSWNVFF
ncbi:ribosomal protein S12 methylthiotransferase accessory factor [Streptomyces sp. 1222.5]|uniref:TOMM precursor leader peptide-binding protein n=1 Tax=unclassified Streptomyces TaxID=2593676 RepID=UPI00089B2C51|nr:MULTISPECIES: TOMM precursor leader peptide-binding protein [unclassified Streptomyces]PKW09370.1 ribosomal protein S12 methylthiotransferase accessory factor [Streptomyces sp. 5112.2]SEC37068.1 ribosomal protein S12 methylthiotransferase accessory factor [Streptomyces sp. 1222.5]